MKLLCFSRIEASWDSKKTYIQSHSGELLSGSSPYNLKERIFFKERAWNKPEAQVRLSLSFFAFQTLLNPVFNNFLYKIVRYWLIYRKLDGTFYLLVGGQLFFESFNC